MWSRRHQQNREIRASKKKGAKGFCQESHELNSPPHPLVDMVWVSLGWDLCVSLALNYFRSFGEIAMDSFHQQKGKKTTGICMKRKNHLYHVIHSFLILSRKVVSYYRMLEAEQILRKTKKYAPPDPIIPWCKTTMTETWTLSLNLYSFFKKLFLQKSHKKSSKNSFPFSQSYRLFTFCPITLLSFSLASSLSKPFENMS